ncbi:MAG: TonB-dependent receptor plug domain-containing protein, partial [Burkholderiaceae bacterium]|nr:TonB-dependent receptor plug domain-containing protein [Burkholderiaceae bacterium]
MIAATGPTGDRVKLWACLLSAAALLPAGQAQQVAQEQQVAQQVDPAAKPAQPTTNEIEQVEVIAPAPLPGLGVNINQIPANVQSIGAKQIEKSHPMDSSETLERNLGSVNINDTQGGPLQADVNFRGFTASPILG